MDGDRDSGPWYREPWPWLLMLGPAIVVVAGLYTAILAVRSDDGLVATDYYRQGLEINKKLSREAIAPVQLRSAIHASGASAARQDEKNAGN